MQHTKEEFVEITPLNHPVECEAPNDQLVKESLIGSNIKYLIVGLMFGIVFVKAEIISWYRIQEMFRLHSFHMYGVIGTAVVVGMISVFLIKKFSIKTMQGEKVVFHDKQFHWGNVIGGLLFGLGWAITGACPGPLFAQIGSGFLVIIVTLLSAIAGTWVYGLLRDKLPH
jgi:uncharacterized membrane protein YedE/YeeE